MNCTRCGTPLADGVKFCTVCGQSVLQNAAAPAAPQVPAAPVAPQVPAAPAAPQVPVAPAPMAPPPSFGSAPAPMAPPPSFGTAPAPTAQPMGYTANAYGTPGGQPQMGYAAPNGVGRPPVAPKPSLFASPIAKIVAAVVAVACVGVWGYKNLYLTPERVVKKAITATATDMMSEMETMANNVPVVAVISDAASKEMQIDYVVSMYDESIAVTTQLDMKNKQLKVFGEIPEMYDFSYAAYVTDEEAVATVGGTGMALGICYETMFQDLAESGYLGDDYADAIDLMETIWDAGLEETVTEMSKEMQAMLKDATPALLDTLVIDEGKDKTIEINDQKVKATRYEVTIDVDELEDVLNDLADEFFEQESMMEYLELMSTLQSYNYYYYGEPMSENEMRRQMDYAIDELISGLEYSLSDYPFNMYVYGGRVVMISVTDEDEMYGGAVVCSPKGNALDYMAALSCSYGEWDEEAVCSVVMEDDKFTATMENSYGEEYGVKYDMSKTRNNFTCYGVDYYGDYEEFTCSVNSEEKNIVTVETEVDGMELEITFDSNGLEKGWFDMPEDYTNVLQMSEGDLMGMMMQFSDFMY